MNNEFETIIEDIYERDVRYREDAYIFVMEALAYTQKKYKCTKHVKGEEMLKGMRELLLNKFGPMTLTVLKHWGITNTEDFGNIVFNLVENRVLSKTEDDTIEEFKDGYDFGEVFDSGYRKQLAKKISRMRS
jgi:uncharacterized repeat protein (TIGR04138 family)